MFYSINPFIKCMPIIPQPFKINSFSPVHLFSLCNVDLLFSLWGFLLGLHIFFEGIDFLGYIGNLGKKMQYCEPNVIQKYSFKQLKVLQSNTTVYSKSYP